MNSSAFSAPSQLKKLPKMKTPVKTMREAVLKINDLTNAEINRKYIKFIAITVGVTTGCFARLSLRSLFSMSGLLELYLCTQT